MALINAANNYIEFYKLYDIECLDFGDIGIIQYVNKKLRGTGAEILTGKESDIKSVISRAIDDFGNIFGKDIADKTYKSVGSVPFVSTNNPAHLFTVCVAYECNMYTRKVNKNSGGVQNIKIPSQIFEEDSVFLGHEFVHVNKETNYSEYKLQSRLGDVLSILYELIAMGDKAREIINTRMHILATEMGTFQDMTRKVKISVKEKDKELYRIIQARSGEYLNSFYYAVVLYGMYKKDPELIIGLSRKVLNHEINTLEMLQMLGIYREGKSSIFESELTELKNQIKVK